MRERRQHQRIAADHDATIRVPGRSPMAYKIRNLSGRGLYIVTRARLPKGRRVGVYFVLPTETLDSQRQVEATVVHRVQGGMGLRINRSSGAVGKRLQALITLCEEFERRG